MKLTKATRLLLGNLLDHAERTVAEMIRARGGNAANVREAGPWADKSLGETAKAGIQGDSTAIKAIKIAKAASRLGRKYGGDAS